MDRRQFVQTAGGTATALSTLSVTGTAAAQEDGGGESSGGEATTVPDSGGWFSDVSNLSDPTSTVGARGQKSAAVEVGVQANGGAFGFGPPAIHVDTGTTVKFEWTGEGGGHNVVLNGDGSLDSGSPTGSAGVNYEYTFEEAGL